MTARFILLTAAAVICWTPAPAEAACLTKAQARAQWPNAYLHWRGHHCWAAKGKDAGAVVDRSHPQPILAAADEKIHADRADTKTVKTFAFIVKPGEEVVPVDPATDHARLDARPQPDALAGADTVPYWYEDERPEALLMPTRDQWAPPEEVPADHSEALWWVLGALVLSVASAALIASWPRRRARWRLL